ncbi:MAG TPA: TonB-dependent receptor [Bryobacteraceae bacterium]|nr:TonB-dependent receptor [Bryobacteraceae bacterium]
MCLNGVFLPRLHAIGMRVSLGLLLASLAYSQVVTATLTGTVTDASGATVPQANVTATETTTGVSRSTVTSAEGVYSLPFLNPGTYRVDIEKAGFKKFSRANIGLGVSTVGRVDAVLAPGSVQETVEVTAEAPLLQAENAEVARNFETQSVTELPIADRSAQAVAGLMAGVGLPVRYSGGPLEDAQTTYLFNANGQPLAANNTMVDGIDNVNHSLGLSIYLPSAEDVEEVHVTTNSYSAEFGRVGGAVVNILTKSGTNQFHGSAWEFNKVAALAARDFFNKDTQPKPHLANNDWGATAGGPVRKDKTFYFVTYEGKTQRSSTTSTASMPQPAWLQGNFSAVPGLLLYDPNTGNADGTGRTPIPNNIVPTSELSPVSLKLNAFMPSPNLSGLTNNYVTQIPLTYNSNSYDGRVDQNLSERTKIYLKFNTSRFHVTQGSLYHTGIGDDRYSRNYTLTGAINLTHGFSPTLLTEVRIAYNRWYDNVESADTVTNQQLGIYNPNPDWISMQTMAWVNIGGMSAIGAGTGSPIIEADNVFPFANTWTKMINKHSIKWGEEFTRYRNDRFQPQGLNLGARGEFWFNPDTTQLNLGSAGGSALGSYGSLANSVASYMFGTPDQRGRTYLTVWPTVRQSRFAGFVQDSYKVTANLTLDLGIRYEYYSAVTPRYPGGASNYEPATNSLLVAGYGNVSMSTDVNAKPTYFAPRLGAAYSINNKTVIRAGYAFSYWEERFGFTGGTLNTQYPVIYNVQDGVQNSFKVVGNFNALPTVNLLPIPSSGIITPAPNQAFYYMPANYTLPSVYNYNFSIQRQVSNTMSIDVGYVGNVGRHLAYAQNLNVGRPGAGPNAALYNVLFGRTASTTIRAYGVNSNYNSLQVNFSKRFAHGLHINAAYAYSKSLDDNSENGGFLDDWNFNRTHGPSSFDQTHMLTVNHVYELPFGKGQPLLNKGGVFAAALSHWQLSGVFRYMTGQPFTPTAPVTSCNCAAVSTIYADVVGSPTYPHGVGPGTPWVSPSAFAIPQANTFGDAGRDILRGPGLTNYDANLVRKFSIKERLNMEFRFEANNALNTPHFANPSALIGSATFGIITASGYNGNRLVQTALRLTF